jgi:hypothetical protein
MTSRGGWAFLKRKEESRFWNYSYQRAMPSPSAKTSARETEVGEIRDQLIDERIAEIEGRPVRLSVRTNGSVVAEMVEPGRFPVSPTGYRSVLFGMKGVLRRMKGETPTPEELYTDAMAGLEGVVEKKQDTVEKAIRRCNEEKTRSPEKPISTIVDHTSPSGHKLANLLLTEEGQKREEIIEAGIRLYEKTIRLEEPEWSVIKEHRAWTRSSYQAKRQQAAETLRMLREARSRGLFDGARNLAPAIEMSTPHIQWAYQGCQESVENTSAEGTIRQVVREELGVDALTGCDLEVLAQLLVKAK